MRLFYTTFSPDKIFQTLSGKFNVSMLAACFPLPWSSYVRLLGVKDAYARNFYEKEALRD
jgi:hypothetical protein